MRKYQAALGVINAFGAFCEHWPRPKKLRSDFWSSCAAAEGFDGAAAFSEDLLRTEPLSAQCPSVLAIHLRKLLIERKEIVQDADKEQAAGEQVKNAGEHLTHVKAVDTEDANEGQQNPGQVVIYRT